MIRMYECVYHVCNVCVNDHIAHHLQDDLAERFPAFDLFFFLKFDALCTANHFIEGSFSNKRYLHPIVKQVIAKASARMKAKGC